MRLLHTADWHLGQHLQGYSRQFEHDRFLDWLLDTLVDQRIDALLIAGDIFDTANPPAAAQQQLYRFLCEARRRLPALQVVMIAGNHDSPARLEAPLPFLEAMAMTVVGAPARVNGVIDLDRLVVPLCGSNGRVAAWCIAVPFLRPGDVPRADGGGDPYLDGIAALYADAVRHALLKRRPGEALIALGHCHLSGGLESQESERRLVIGGVEALSTRIFAPELAYIGLGHLHLAQQVGESRIRYSGSPIPMSFSETGYHHQVLRIDLDGEQLAGVTALPVPRPVPFLRIPGEPADPETVLAALQELALPAADPEHQPYLMVRVRLDRPEPGLRQRIEQALADQPVRLVRIETVQPARDAEAGNNAPLGLERVDPETVFRRLWDKQWREAPDAAVLTAFRDLLNGHDGDCAP